MSKTLACARTGGPFPTLMTARYLLCDPARADAALMREEVWRDEHWRLALSQGS